MLIISWFSMFFILAMSESTGLLGISDYAKIQFFLFILSFFLGAICCGVILNNNVKHNQKIVKTKAGNKYLFLFIVVFVFIEMYLSLNIYVFNSVDLNVYRESFFDGSRGNLYLFHGVYGFYGFYFLSLILFALTPFIVVMGGRILSLLCAVSLLLYDVIYLSRTGIYYFILSYAASVLILRRDIKKILIVGVLALLFSLVMSFYRDAQNNVLETIFRTVVNYHIAPFVLFDKNIITNSIIHYKGDGLASLGIYNFVMYPFNTNVMSSINDLRAQLNVFYDLGSVGYIPYNAYYTTLGLIYVDFGFLGSILISFISGFIVVFLENRGRQSARFLIASVFFTVLCMESLFSSITLNIFAFTIPLFFLLLTVLKI